MKTKLGVTITLLLLAIGEMSAATLYVDSKNSNPMPPYSSWSTAATNIQDAVEAAPSGALVLVNDGVYIGGVVVSTPLILMSVNGAQSTVIDGGGTNRCLYLTNNTWVWGFTFTNGYAGKGAGVWGTETNCFLTNCVVTGNSAGTGGGSYSGTFYNCLFTGNIARSNGYGGAALSSTLYNCTVSANSAAAAGGVSQSTLYNSIVYDNTAPTNANYSSSTFNYCCTMPLPAGGAGNITNAPLFVNEANGNFRLQAGSPCINAGNNSYNGANGLTDLDGNPRFWGVAVDMGAYEYQPSSAPSITAQPASQTVYAGSTVGFSVGASGSRPLFWQWQFGRAPINGATDSTLTLTAVTPSQAGSYSVVVTNGFGAVTSQVAILTVMDGKPSITVQPMNQTVYAGSNVVFSAAASGSVPLSWQWQFNGAAIVGATYSTLTLASVTTNLAGGYSVVVTNTQGSVTSQVAVLTVLLGPPPSITLQPISQTVSIGSSVSLTVAASGLLPLSWQWLFNGKVIQDATNSTLTMTEVTADQAGTYSVIVSNAAGTATSSNATLIVRVPETKYVWQNSPAPTVPYTSWVTAAHTIQDAVDFAVAGDTVLVTNGVYAAGSRTVFGPFDAARVVVTTGVEIRSVNGPGFTIIDGGGTNQCFAAMTNGTRLSGFTLTNGMALQGGGASSYALGAGLLTNCVLTGNMAFFSGGGAYNCTLYDCTLAGNSLATNGAGAASCTLYNCTLIGNLAEQDGAAAFLCNLYNCVITSNWLAGADQSTLYNCTVTSNPGGTSSSKLFNCILYYNPTLWGANYWNCTFSYCCTTPMPTDGFGNITNAPLLADQAKGDFHLQPFSPCINAGNNAFVSGATDLEGNPRIVGGTVDMGAYEFQTPGSAISYAWLQQYGLTTDGSADYADTDRDGMNNWEEWVCGTCPTNAQSVLRLVSVAPAGSNVTVTWQSVPGMNYFLERSAYLGSPFTLEATNIVGLSTNIVLISSNSIVVGTNIVGQASTTTYTDTNSAGVGSFFYRVGVQHP